MTVVVNSTPLIYLAAIGRFDLLQLLYGSIVIPTAVFTEVVTQGTGKAGAAETASATWIERRDVSDRSKLAVLATALHGGESEVVALAEELHADLVIMDETAGRRELASRGLSYIGTVGVLTEAKRRGVIQSLKSELDRLRGCGFHLSDRVYQACLAAVGE
jgi:predicted nucleic acid-binding protein